MKNIGNEYSWQGLLGVSILMIFGVCILFFTGAFQINNLNMIYEYFYFHGFEAIISLFFIFVAIYCYYLYIFNVLIKPKETIMYLSSIEDSICNFINRKGKKYFYLDNGYKINNYYKVLCTKNKIDKIINISNENFELPKIKERYWLNFYSPLGNYENLFLLPIVYVIFIPGLLSFIMAKGYQKIVGLLFMSLPLYIIIYDLIYKTKKKKSPEVNDILLQRSYQIIVNIIQIIPVIVVNVIITWILIKSSDNISKLIISPFFLCATCSLFYTVSNIFKIEKLKKICLKIYISIFLLYWFSLLTYGSYSLIKESSYSMLLFTIPFWIFGLYIVYKNFIKK